MSAPSIAKTDCDAALAIHRELLSEICRAVGVGHGAGGQQQQLAEVALVQRQARDFFARKMFAAAAWEATRFAAAGDANDLPLGGKLQRGGECCALGKNNGLWRVPLLYPRCVTRDGVVPGGNIGKDEIAAGDVLRSDFVRASRSSERRMTVASAYGIAGGVAQHALPTQTVRSGSQPMGADSRSAEEAEADRRGHR